MASHILYYHRAIEDRYVLVPADAQPGKEVRQYRTTSLIGADLPPVFATRHHLEPLWGEADGPATRGEGAVYTVLRNTLVSQRTDLAEILGASGEVGEPEEATMPTAFFTPECTTARERAGEETEPCQAHTETAVEAAPLDLVRACASEALVAIGRARLLQVSMSEGDRDALKGALDAFDGARQRVARGVNP